MKFGVKKSMWDESCYVVDSLEKAIDLCKAFTVGSNMPYWFMLTDEQEAVVEEIEHE